MEIFCDACKTLFTPLQDERIKCPNCAMNNERNEISSEARECAMRIGMVLVNALHNEVPVSNEETSPFIQEAINKATLGLSEKLKCTNREHLLRDALIEFVRCEQKFGHGGQHSDSECVDCKRVRKAQNALSRGFLCDLKFSMEEELTRLREENTILKAADYEALNSSNNEEITQLRADCAVKDEALRKAEVVLGFFSDQHDESVIKQVQNALADNAGSELLQKIDSIKKEAAHYKDQHDLAISALNLSKDDIVPNSPVGELLQKMKGLEEDKKRFDWLDKNSLGIDHFLYPNPDGNNERDMWCVENALPNLLRGNVREAIDAAINQQKG